MNNSGGSDSAHFKKMDENKPALNTRILVINTNLFSHLYNSVIVENTKKAVFVMNYNEVTYFPRKPCFCQISY